MALWPFRRKSRRKRPRNTADEAGRGRKDESTPTTMHADAITDATRTTAGSPSLQLQPSLSKKRQSPNKLRRRTYSFSPGRRDSIRVASRKGTARPGQEAVPPVPSLAAGTYPGTYINAIATSTGHDGDSHRPDSGVAGTAVSEGNNVFFERAPTLHNKRDRDGDHLPRKKSSKKRRKNDHAREAEIKAMANFMPHRPPVEQWDAGSRPPPPTTTKKESSSKRVRSGFGFGLRGAARHEWDKENRPSEISLPSPESIHSAMSSDSEPIAWKVSAFEALAPRPTLRYVNNPRLGSADVPPKSAAKRPVHPKKLPAPLPEDLLRAHKRIDDLANDLSASALRELMERDQRRRDRKREREQEGVERRLVWRVEKQREAEAAAAREGRESPANLERGVLGREVVGLGLDPTSAIVTSSRRRPSDASSPTHSTKSPRQLEKSLAGEDVEKMEIDSRPHPLEAFHRTNSIAVENLLEQKETQIPGETPLPVLAHTPSPKSPRNFLGLRKSRSKSPQSSMAKVTAPSETSRVASASGTETSSSKVKRWTSIFRRWSLRKRRTQGGDEPSSFSNTSRDSIMAAGQQIPTPQSGNYVARKVSSGVPKRTMSRFREDLPELPLTPPQSSEAPEPIPPTIAEASPNPDVQAEDMFDPTFQGPRFDTPTSGHRSIPRDTGSGLSHREEFTPSPDPPSMSLASIDSEGSWLSGRVGNKKRHSSGILEISSARNRALQRNSDSDKPHENNSNEDASVADDEYLSRFTRGTKGASWAHQSTGEARPSSDIDEEKEARWGSVRGHQPNLVHKPVMDRMKSYEGILKDFGEGDSEMAHVEGENAFVDADSPVIEEAGLQRATSVKLPGHMRKISAGSAKLLQLTPRSSVDAKRRSWEPPKVQEETA